MNKKYILRTILIAIGICMSYYAFFQTETDVRNIQTKIMKYNDSGELLSEKTTNSTLTVYNRIGLFLLFSILLGGVFGALSVVIETILNDNNWW